VSGIPGTGGPVPKRSAQRRRRNKTDVPVTTAEGAAIVEPPAGNAKWHPAAKRWYEALAESGQAAFYEPSDWATAYVIAESMSRDLRPQPIGVDRDTGDPVMALVPIKGTNLAAYLRAMTSLLVTEGDRRRARVELERGGEAEAHPDVPNIDDYRRRAG